MWFNTKICIKYIQYPHIHRFTHTLAHKHIHIHAHAQIYSRTHTHTETHAYALSPKRIQYVHARSKEFIKNFNDML